MRDLAGSAKLVAMGAGLICLQGGRELTLPCRAMDTAVLEQTGGGPVAVLAGAARVGSDYAGASARATSHYASLGADVRVVPDPRQDVDGALAALTEDLSLVVLPGGSPSSLLGVLTADTGVGDRLVELHARGTAISGSSAGAMVLCDRLFVPDGRPPRVVAGLGLAPGLALVHWKRGGGRGWPTDGVDVVWGLPECGGVLLLGDGEVFAVGEGEPSRSVGGTWEAVARATDP